MAAERTPHHTKSFMSRPLGAMTALIIRYPWPTIVLAVASSLAAVWYTQANLGYRTSRLDLLNRHSEYNRLWIEYIEEFGDEDDAVVVVEGPGREAVVPVLKEISGQLGQEGQYFHSILHEVDLSHIRSKGLHYLPQPELLGVEGFLNEVGPVTEGHWQPLVLSSMLGGMNARLHQVAPVPQSPAAVATLGQTQALVNSLQVALSGRQQYQSPWPQMPQSFSMLSELQAEYLLAKEGKLGFVLLRLSRGDDGFTRGTAATDALRALIADVSKRHPEAKIGLTGLPIMENDEMRSSQSSMVWASGLSFIGVAVLFVAGFGGVRHALLANVVLLVGMAWAFGYVTLTVGHLNILSVSFTVTMIGIGIDYGIHYIARYLQLRRDGLNCDDAIMATATGTGPAIIVAGLTTSASFFAAGFTSFTGISELGFIAGGGLLLCALSEMVLLPATLVLVDRKRHVRDLPEPLAVDRWIQPFIKYPRVTLITTMAVTIVCVVGLRSVWYDHNLLNLQPVGLESVELERKLLSESDQSVWYALSIADSREELLARKAQFLKLPAVERTEEIVSMLPSDHEVKGPIIERIGKKLAHLQERPPQLPADRPEDLGRLLSEMQASVNALPGGGPIAWQIEQLRDALRRLPASECYALTSRFQQQMAGDLLTRLHILQGMANPEPPKISDLPESLTSRFVGHHGRHLLKIYGRGNLWDMNSLQKFVAQVRTVDPRATGNPLQTYEASLEMKKSYQNSAIYAVVIILAVMYFEFRSVRYTLLASLPLILGLLQTFGLMGWFNIPFNPANMIALPLTLGIGVDLGVHITHEFLNTKGRYRITTGTAVAALTDGLTTIVGFGTLIIASHQGLQSLGRVLTLGVTCCMFTSMVMLPAFLSWLRRNEPEEEGVAEAQPARRSIWRRRDPAHRPPGTGPVATPEPSRSANLVRG